MGPLRLHLPLAGMDVGLGGTIVAGVRRELRVLNVRDAHRLTGRHVLRVAGELS
jgi:hypothetical protein